MAKFIELTGQRFGRLVVIERGNDHIQPSGKPISAWLCACDCGATAVVLGQGLRSCLTKSCGCLNKDVHTTHGGSKSRGKRTPEYRAWSSAKDRCYNENGKMYKYYGGRGIAMCDSWRHDFGQFISDMGGRPDGYSLERIDFNGNYEPDNCKWIPRGDQAKNRRGNHVVNYEGLSLTLAEWARTLNVPYETIRHQFRYDGVSFAEIVERARKRAAA